MEYTAAIPEGEWISHSLGGMYTADHWEADFMMVQLLGDCPTISDMVVPDPFWTGHEESTFVSANLYEFERPDYSLFPTSSDHLYISSDSHPTLVENSVKSNEASMSTGFYGGEVKNTSSHLIEGEVDEWLNRENIDRDVEESVRYQMRQEPADSRHDICNTVSKKRSKHSENEKMNKRRRKSKKSCNDEEDDNCSSMAFQMQMSGGMSSNESAALNLNGKSRPSRGSATDAQSLYARRRREKINERLRILQNLVPNGTKVDISTMLEEAVNYVKFLQLQIKMLSSDDLWMYSPVCYNGMVFGLDRAESLQETYITYI